MRRVCLVGGWMASVLIVSACGPVVIEPGASTTSVLQIVADGEYSRWDLVPVAESFPSALSSDYLDLWVSDFGADAYLAADPGIDGSGTALPEGTIILRDVLDSGGERAKVTIMVKREPGYFPEGGDFWYGVTDTEGSILPDDSGHEQAGALETCAGCHAGRSSDGFIFGVPPIYRM